MKAIGLCTLLASAALLESTDLLVEAVGIALCGSMVLAATGSLLGGLGKSLPDACLPTMALPLAATLVSLAGIALGLLDDALYQSLAMGLPLLVPACMGLVLTASPAAAGWRVGLSFAGLALTLGLLREALGQGTLFAHFERLFGAPASGWTLVLGDNASLPLLALAPGGFLLLGLLLAARQHLLTVNPEPEER